eukprot:TRINITY_DN964_c0_g1_i3.p1 TRINITY_DN964_c0_g1~~TRINITY_DN964_c0_g1_i3.p1  ORF type:complete len:385 (+),score=112.21 TRINITY_DN964_c0_g1_i3:215-1369(+)
MSATFHAGPSSPPASPSLRAVTAHNQEIDTRDDLKDHYHSEWHLHNLKRKVAGLPLLTKEQFARRQAQDKINQLKSQPVGKQAKKEARLAKQKEKQQERQLQREEKLASKSQGGSGKKKKTVVVKRQVEQPVPEEECWSDQEPMEEEDEDDYEDEEDEEIKIIEGECLFDSEIFDDWGMCLEYMEDIYGFILPDIERVIDMEGLCQYLQLKVNHCYRCVYSSKRFNSREAVKHYMESKGNRRLNSETFKIEFGRFYAEEEAVEGAMNVTQEEIDEALEKGMTPSGKKLIPRDLAWAAKQRGKPEEQRADVLAVKAETDIRIVKMAEQYGKPGQLANASLFFKGATPRNEIGRRDVHRISKHAIKAQIKGNKLFQLSDAALTHGR